MSQEAPAFCEKCVTWNIQQKQQIQKNALPESNVKRKVLQHDMKFVKIELRTWVLQTGPSNENAWLPIQQAELQAPISQVLSRLQLFWQNTGREAVAQVTGSLILCLINSGKYFALC